MESWLYNPELAMMSWRLQVLAMHQQFQHQALPAPFVPFHLQPGPEYSVTAHLPQFPQAGAIKQEQEEQASSPPLALQQLIKLIQQLAHQSESLVPRQDHHGAE